MATDTAFYTGPAATTSFRALFDYIRTNPVITPINNLLYNSQTSNLARHGLHPHYQHFLANLPQLLGPAIPLLLQSAWPFTKNNLNAMLQNNRLTSSISGALILSIFPHQEARFLLPCVPLLLTCIRLPTSAKTQRYFWVSWAIFNSLLGILMGTYHQAGIVPAQLAMPRLVQATINQQDSSAQAFWWKTYPPPVYLLGSPPLHPTREKPINITTTPLLGLNQTTLLNTLSSRLPPCSSSTFASLLPSLSATSSVYLAAPLSAWRLDPLPPLFNFSITTHAPELRLTHLATFRAHLNLDDMDFGDDGVVPTLRRVVGRRGMGIWKVNRICGEVSDTGERG